MTQALPLMERLARALQSGPRTGVELAETVLGLTGPAAILEQTVDRLLRDDPRFESAPGGGWQARVSPEAGLHPRPLASLSFAVVDVETTGGGYDRGDRITEIAVVPVHQGVVGDGFSTLVNPGCPIPPRIEALTGISNAMVRGAPPFEAVAAAVSSRIEGRVFTAHNVAFDWGFVGRSLAASEGAAPEVERLCTVRMGRVFLPGLRSYALDSLTRTVGIPITGRHRAWGDALATAHLLVHLLERAQSEGVDDWERLRARLTPGSRAARTGRPGPGPGRGSSSNSSSAQETRHG
jgi:DNA polymerase III epsilon subunit family exonuclease